MDQHFFDPCEFAIERYKNIAKWRNLWTILLFVFGTTVIVFLCASILLFIDQNWLPGAIATIGTIVNGMGVRWVVERRSEAVKEEAEAYGDLKAVCGGTTPSRMAVAGPSDDGVPREVLDFREKLRLLGRIR